MNLGIFDSGLGGLTVLREILKNNSYDKIIYYGDTLRVPYGSKDKETIELLTRNIIAFLRKKGADEIVVACGTITTNVLDEIKNDYDFNIVGIVDCTCKQAISTTKNNKIGVIATAATINTHVFKTKMESLKDVVVYEVACPNLASLIEKGDTNGEEIKKILNDSLSPLKENNIDTLILGCTHYPIVADKINKFFDGKVNLIDSGSLLSKELNKGKIIRPEIEFYVSGSVDDFIKNAKQIIDLTELTKTQKETI